MAGGRRDEGHAARTLGVHAVRTLGLLKRRRGLLLRRRRWRLLLQQRRRLASAAPAALTRPNLLLLRPEASLPGRGRGSEVRARRPPPRRAALAAGKKKAVAPAGLPPHGERACLGGERPLECRLGEGRAQGLVKQQHARAPQLRRHDAMRLGLLLELTIAGPLLLQRPLALLRQRLLGRRLCQPHLGRLGPVAAATAGPSCPCSHAAAATAAGGSEGASAGAACGRRGRLDRRAHDGGGMGLGPAPLMGCGEGQRGRRGRREAALSVQALAARSAVPMGRAHVRRVADRRERSVGIQKHRHRRAGGGAGHLREPPQPRRRDHCEHAPPPDLKAFP